TQLSCAMLFVFFILVLILVYMSVTAITKPLSELSSVALRIAQKDFEVPLFNNNDSTEIGTICRAFDRMTISIRDYIDQIWEKAAKETELREKEMEARELYAAAQLRALQNQINPHFLFNTLNTGAQLAMIEGADKTCYFMEQVADFFRYNISQKGQAATIDEELALIDNFVYIMKVRFGERFEFVKNVSNEKHLQRLPRMILQPLVENCIKHGYNSTKIRVELSVEPELYMTKVSVSDNGSGFDPELKKTLLSLNPEVKDVEKADSGQLDSEKQVSKSAEGNGTGLVNVISRLRLYFHRYDVFDILENEGGGTKFLLRIPNV
ncbi:MAG: histidine kinase, partial [Treponema sp.]|uniref:sensor histidine kinase n=1 Tax=Treponema sp. TaxID=166 RepID=UPI002A90B0C2